MTDKTTNWKIGTLNVKGKNKDEKFDDMLDWINQERLDITIVTETKLHPSNAYHTSLLKIKNIFPTGQSILIIQKDQE